jgi:hypothetical protein
VLLFLVRFHLITAPLFACTAAIRLASEITPGWEFRKYRPRGMARFAITRRAPAGAVRDRSENSALALKRIDRDPAPPARRQVLRIPRPDLVGGPRQRQKK